MDSDVFYPFVHTSDSSFFLCGVSLHDEQTPWVPRREVVCRVFSYVSTSWFWKIRKHIFVIYFIDTVSCLFLWGVEVSGPDDFPPPYPPSDHLGRCTSVFTCVSLSLSYFSPFYNSRRVPLFTFHSYSLANCVLNPGSLKHTHTLRPICF